MNFWQYSVYREFSLIKICCSKINSKAGIDVALATEKIRIRWVIPKIKNKKYKKYKQEQLFSYTNGMLLFLVRIFYIVFRISHQPIITSNSHIFIDRFITINLSIPNNKIY